MTDKQHCMTMRITVLIFSAARAGLCRSRMQGTPIYELVSGAYQVPLVGAFVPLVCGLYWQRATTQGAVALGRCSASASGCCSSGNGRGRKEFPGQLAGLLASFGGMVAGSLAPQWVSQHAHAAPAAGRSTAPDPAAGCERARPIIEGFASGRRPLLSSPSMPIYAYKCSACGFAKDVLQKMSDAPLSECPSCGASAFSKQLTAAGFQLKGSGWYVTDFREAAARRRPGADADENGRQPRLPTARPPSRPMPPQHARDAPSTRASPGFARQPGSCLQAATEARHARACANGCCPACWSSFRWPSRWAC